MSVTIKTAVTWNVTPCSLLEVHPSFQVTCCLYFQTQKVNPGSSDNYFMEVLSLQILSKFGVTHCHLYECVKCFHFDGYTR
jgi:hypothetical protein